MGNLASVAIALAMAQPRVAAAALAFAIAGFAGIMWLTSPNEQQLAAQEAERVACAAMPDGAIVRDRLTQERVLVTLNRCPYIWVRYESGRETFRYTWELQAGR